MREKEHCGSRAHSKPGLIAPPSFARKELLAVWSNSFAVRIQEPHQVEPRKVLG